MAIDVEQVLKQYEHAPINEPMHGKAGEPRRNPSTDQKRVRREISRKADLEDLMSEPVTEADLLRKAAKATTLAEQRDLLTQVEQLRTAKMREADAARQLDLVNAKINDTLVPGFVHEHVTASTDWLLELPPSTASQDQAAHKMVAEATMWFARVNDDVKNYPEEYFEQAKNFGRRIASQYEDNAEHAFAAFEAEAKRLHAQAVKLGKIQVTEEGDVSAHGLARTASLEDGGHMMAHDLERPGEMTQIETPKELPDPGAELPAEPMRNAPGGGEFPKQPGMRYQPGGGGRRSPFGEHLDAPTNGVEELSREFVDSQLSRAASLSREAGASEDAEVAQEMFGDDPYDDTQKTAGHMTEFDATQAQPVNTVETFADNPVTSTDSRRAPAIQEILNYDGWNGTSVVPQGPSPANQLNDNTSGYQNASANSSITGGGFPVGAALIEKESSMSQEHAQCPTCGGQGKVAVRKLAYSGLPQVDQIVNADETPGATPLPPDVAFPLTGWAPGNVEQKIQETEQQIANRPQGVGGAPGAPVGPGGSVAASLHTANGRDNSGWIGDMGARGIDYPGNSAPVGYDGSNQLGQPDPVYGYGGDQGNRPLRPYGHEEEPDITNNPGQPYTPGMPHNNDQGYREVSPGMSTAGSRDPFIAAAQEEIVRQQELIRVRAAMLRGQG